MTDFVPGNRIRLLCTGKDYFPALERAIDEAQREIFLETYIFEDDATGQSIRAALHRAANRGVQVHLLLDGFGCSLLPKDFFQDLRQAGGDVLIFRPDIARYRIKRYRLRRLHRKIAIVDEQIAFVGGINIVGDMTGHQYDAPRLDYAVSVEGPLLAEILVTVRRLWQLVSWLTRHERPSRSWQPPQLAPVGEMLAAFVVRDNIRHRRDIEEAYLAAINGATREILIANSYFLPGIGFRRALLDAAARGVRVVLLLQGRMEYFFVHYATRALFDELMSAGIEIYEYRRSYLHAKVAVIDECWATVGSSNIDPLSLLLAREANVVVKHQGFAAGLRSQLLEAMAAGATRVDIRRGQWGWVNHSLSRLCYGLLRSAMGLTGYAIDKDHGA